MSNRPYFESAVALYDAGYRPVLLKPNSKAPANTDWNVDGSNQISRAQLESDLAKCTTHIVDCLNEYVPSRNNIGVKNRERLAIAFYKQNCRAPDVRALRKDFPTTVHQNGVHTGEPKSLCLDSQTWATAERSWTPQRFLKRILWWLEAAAKEELSSPGQPIEQFFLGGPGILILPFDYQKIEPSDLSSKLGIARVFADGSTQTIFVGELLEKNPSFQNAAYPTFVPIGITTPPVIQNMALPWPNTLGELHDCLHERGVPFFSLLSDKIRELVPEGGIQDTTKTHIILIVTIPIKRQTDKNIEKVEERAFLISKSLAKIGVGASLLCKDEKNLRYYKVLVFAQSNQPTSESWRDEHIIPLNVKTKISQNYAQTISGVDEKSAHFDGLLVGVGALGGCLLEIWSKEAWGHWTILDDDIVEPHNVVRHVAKDCCIGLPKVEVVKSYAESNYQNGLYSVTAIKSALSSSPNDAVIDTMKASDIIIDASTTLAVPRDISGDASCPRSFSTFLTPSGQAAVLLAEDEKRKIGLFSLENQYYRAILNSAWGETHLDGHTGRIFVGSGCRDVSVIMSYSTILHFAGLLAKQIRIAKDATDAKILVWVALPIRTLPPAPMAGRQWRMSKPHGQRPLRSSNRDF